MSEQQRCEHTYPHQPHVWRRGTERSISEAPECPGIEPNRYAKGELYRVELDGCSLTYTVPLSYGATTFGTHALARGDLIRSAGIGYSGGSDGINLPEFDEVNGERVSRGHFNPNSWGSPRPDALTRIES